MTNLYSEIMSNKQLYILEEQNTKVPCVNNKKVAVVINLYYFEGIDYYLAYIKQIPYWIDCYIYTSNKDVKCRLIDEFKNVSNYHIYDKKNRGRDISALLVEFRKIYKNYDVFCFVHDKKAINSYLKKDVDFWIRNIWDNLINSEKYICQILNLLDKNDTLGFLAPPAPIGEYKSDWYTNTWYVNFENTKELAEQLKLNCDLESDIPPIALGTVFWCKTDALKKILDVKWEYSDFQDEPLSTDGTLSHAIERILPYVAQDAGYTAGIIMCRDYAETLILRVQQLFYDCFGFCREEFLVESVHQLLNVKQEKLRIEEAFQQFEKVYIYGAGFFGKKFMERMGKMGYKPTGFLVTNSHKSVSQVEGINVYELEEVLPDSNAFIFVAINYDLQEEFVNKLMQYGCTNYFKVCIH